MKIGTKYRSKHGNLWRVVKLNHPSRGRVQIQDEKGTRMDVAEEILKAGKSWRRVRWYHGLFKKKGK